MIIKLCNNKFLIATCLVTIVTSLILVKRKRGRKRISNSKLTIIHYKDAFSKCPSRSIELIQLETWLRIHNIRYELKLIHSLFYTYQSRPEIYLNGTTFIDVDEVFSFLEKKHGKDLSDNLNRIEKCLARSFSVFFEQSLKRCILAFIYFYGNTDGIEISWFELLFNKLFLKKEIRLNSHSFNSKEKGKNFFFNFFNLNLKCCLKYLKKLNMI